MCLFGLRLVDFLVQKGILVVFKAKCILFFLVIWDKLAILVESLFLVFWERIVIFIKFEVTSGNYFEMVK